MAENLRSLKSAAVFEMAGKILYHPAGTDEVYVLVETQIGQPKWKKVEKPESKETPST